MYENAIEILKKLSDSGFEAYIVGGYPRNKYLGLESKDIDICTNARPIDILSVFDDVDMSNSSYGNVRLSYGEFLYEITTFRNDKPMLDGNRSYSVEYVSSLKEDLLRRDFIMNTLCINQNGEYIDLFDARCDIDSKIIRTVKDPSISFKEDPLRILRAIRFSTTLDFSLSKEIVSILPSIKSYIKKLSFYHSKKELDLIFSNKNCMKGISYLKEFDLDSFLLLDLSNINYCSNYLGIWAQSSFGEQFQFSNKEKDIINKIRRVLSLESSNFVLYEYGTYICSIVDEINGNEDYHKLNEKIPIHNRNEININKEFLLLNVPKHLISTIYKSIEYEILSGNLENEEEKIKKYILEKI